MLGVSKNRITVVSTHNAVYSCVIFFILVLIFFPIRTTINLLFAHPCMGLCTTLKRCIFLSFLLISLFLKLVGGNPVGNMLQNSHWKFWFGTQEFSFAPLSHPKRFRCQWFITKLWQMLNYRENCAFDLRFL